MISEEDARINYRDLAETYLRELYSVDLLEEKFLNCNANFMPPIGTKELITLYNKPRIENLTEEEFEYLSKLSEEPAENQDLDRVVDFLEQTYRKVLYLPGWEFGDGRTGEFYPDIHGDGILPVDSIVFRFQDAMPNIPLEKMNAEEENKKTRIFLNVKAQFEKLVNKEDKDFVWLLRF